MKRVYTKDRILTTDLMYSIIFMSLEILKNGHKKEK